LANRTLSGTFFALILIFSLFGIQSGQSATITVDVLADNASGGDGDCTLREAINNANGDNDTTGTDCAAGSGSDTIIFSTSGTIVLGTQLPLITDADALTIDGTGQTVTISGNNAVRVMSVQLPGTLHIRALTIANGNAGFNFGGGIFSNGGTLTVSDSTFRDNSAFVGGAINQTSGTVTITNSTFSGNSSLDDGGAIYSQGSFLLTITVTNSTFSGNSAGRFGGAIRIIIGTLHLSNSILANSTNGDCSNSGGTIATNINNLIEDGDCSPAFSGDPMLDPAGLANNGGPTQTIALVSGSPAIDQADATTCANGPVNNLDQRGFARPIDGDAVPGAVCDIGAFEFGATGEAPILLIIDEETIDNSTSSIVKLSKYSPFCGAGSSAICINDDIAKPSQRNLLFTRKIDVTPYSGLVLPTGKKGDEGLFQFTNPDLQISQQNGATFSLQEFIFAQGAASNENNLDKVSGIRPLNATQITELDGKTVCAVVYDSDISVDLAANFASLKGSTLGLTAFTVTGVTPVSKGLPKITVDLLDSSEVVSTCEAVLPPEL
jgi:CSLREA domain-containing protein